MVRERTVCKVSPAAMAVGALLGPSRFEAVLNVGEAAPDGRHLGLHVRRIHAVEQHTPETRGHVEHLVRTHAVPRQFLHTEPKARR